MLVWKVNLLLRHVVTLPGNKSTDGDENIKIEHQVPILGPTVLFLVNHFEFPEASA